MVVADELDEYLIEIRGQVCNRCVERPPGGPPCVPLGKSCGIEMHLPQLIDAIHEVRSELADPYLLHNRVSICDKCAFLHSDICPCPMEYLLVLIIQAVETVDQRRQRRGEMIEKVGSMLRALGKADLEEIRKAYEDAAGTWTGCDWPTNFGKTGLDLNGCTAAQARARVAQAASTNEREDWEAAAQWLTGVELHTKRAEARAAKAVAAATAGDWQQALQHAHQAWALEFTTGRLLCHGFPLTWQRLRQLVEAAVQCKEQSEN